MFHARYPSSGLFSGLARFGSADDQINKLSNTERFKPDKDFAGVDRAVGKAARDGPVQFEARRDETRNEADPFVMGKVGCRDSCGVVGSLSPLWSPSIIHASSLVPVRR